MQHRIAVLRCLLKTMIFLCNGDVCCDTCGHCYCCFCCSMSLLKLRKTTTKCRKVLLMCHHLLRGSRGERREKIPIPPAMPTAGERMPPHIQHMRRWEMVDVPPPAGRRSARRCRSSWLRSSTFVRFWKKWRKCLQSQTWSHDQRIFSSFRLKRRRPSRALLPFFLFLVRFFLIQKSLGLGGVSSTGSDISTIPVGRRQYS